MARKNKAAVVTCRPWEMPPERSSDARPTVAQLEAQRKDFFDHAIAYVVAILYVAAFVVITAVKYG